MPYYDHDGRTLYYEYEGIDNHPIVFFHGGLGNSRSHWGHQLDDSQFKSKFTLIAPDFRGFGKSGNPEKGENIPTQIILDDINYLITQHLKVNIPAIIVGYSIGAAMAIDYAVEYPDSVAALCLVSPRPFSFKNLRSLPSLSKENRNKSRLTNLYWGILKKIQRIITKRSLKKVLKKEPEKLDKFKQIQHVPTMIIYADKDSVTPSIAFDILKEHLPKAEIVEFSGDHGISHEQSEKFNKVLYEFCVKSEGKTENHISLSARQ